MGTDIELFRVALMLAVGISFLLGACLSVLVHFWIVRPIDKILGTPALMLEKGIPVFSHFLRCSLYASRIHKKQRKNWYDDTMFRGFNFQEYSSSKQKVLSSIYVHTGRVFLVSGITFAIIDYFLYSS